ncbi:Uma2 family endonuclease [Actinocorallia populi]|uniref:Uma2 family endonuclease n=1 Tax=Actinocorallia populi TaxID=2079200 RepID=UPI000D08E3FC|nr:Uma2 family endonuclease [Actinocorallia populi]
MVIVSVPPEFSVSLPEEDTPYGMWLRGELEDYLHLPELFYTEIIDGEIVVSRAPAHGHNQIIESIGLPFRGRLFNDSSFPWRCSQCTGLDMVGIEQGFLPDLMILDARLYQEASREHRLVSDQIEMVVEVTSPSNAGNDRRPAKANTKFSKWRDYAQVGIPYYLLVDRDPKAKVITLYSIPDAATGAYLQEESWKFGETVVLPEHLGVEIPTDEWLPWDLA